MYNMYGFGLTSVKIFWVSHYHLGVNKWISINGVEWFFGVSEILPVLFHTMHLFGLGRKLSLLW